MGVHLVTQVHLLQLQTYSRLYVCAVTSARVLRDAGNERRDALP